MTLTKKITNPQKINLDKNGFNIFFNNKLINIGYVEIQKIELKREKNLKRSFFASIIGVLISVFSLYLIIINTSIEKFSNITFFQNTSLLYLSLYVFLFFGIAIIVTSNLKSTVMIIFTKKDEKLLININKQKNEIIEEIKNNTDIEIIDKT